MPNAEDLAAIRAVTTDYIEGMIYGHVERLRRAFHPKAIQAGHFNGVYEFFSAEEFIESLKSLELQRPGTPYTAEIVSIDLTGDVAVVKVTNTCFGTDFTDYLTMIRDQGRWQIVTKAFFDHANA